jgi:hypothetical protein
VLVVERQVNGSGAEKVSDSEVERENIVSREEVALLDETVMTPVGYKLPYGRINDARVVVKLALPLAG